MKLLGTNTKIEKSVKGYLLRSMSLAPHKTATTWLNESEENFDRAQQWFAKHLPHLVEKLDGLRGKSFNACPGASEGCIAACINTSGMGQFDNVQFARIVKMLWFIIDRKGFIAQLDRELRNLSKKCDKLGVHPAVRLNTYTDIPFYRITDLMHFYDNIQFYDYTKVKATMRKFLAMDMPANYHLTWSLSEGKESYDMARYVLSTGGTVAVPFRDALPKTFLEHGVIDGEISDARWLDNACSVVGLAVKGKGKKDLTGFIVDAKASSVAA